MIAEAFPWLTLPTLALVIWAEWQIGKRWPKYSGAAICGAVMLPGLLVLLAYILGWE